MLRALPSIAPRRAPCGPARAPEAARARSRPRRDSIVEAGLRCDYATLLDPELQAPGTNAPERALLAVAAFASDVRLIDNVVLGEDAPVEVGG